MAVSKKTARIIAAGLFALTLLFALAPTALAAVYWGQSGETVRRVQQKLKQWGYYTGAVDGVFGQSTYDAVIQFQKKNGLTADGVAGTATLAAMGISETTAASAVTTAASGYASEVELLARLIHGEARGEPYVGMVAVGAVVLNRVKSSRFPNTMAGVIYQSGAFDAVSDGQINLAPSEQSRRAARDAMNGWDPTGGYGHIFVDLVARGAADHRRSQLCHIKRDAMEERKGAQVMLAALTVMLCLSIGASGVFRLREANVRREMAMQQQREMADVIAAMADIEVNLS